MWVRISLHAAEGPRTDDKPQPSGEAAHEYALDRFIEFEVVTSVGNRIHAEGEFWESQRINILQAIAEQVYDNKVVNMALPLQTELFKWNPHGQELTLDYIHRCSECDEGMSEAGIKGLCHSCHELPPL